MLWFLFSINSSTFSYAKMRSVIFKSSSKLYSCPLSFNASKRRSFLSSLAFSYVFLCILLLESKVKEEKQKKKKRFSYRGNTIQAVRF